MLYIILWAALVFIGLSFYLLLKYIRVVSEYTDDLEWEIVQLQIELLESNTRLKCDIDFIYESLLEHKSSFKHPYKTDKQVKIWQAKSYMKAYDDFIEENWLSDEEIL